MSDVRPGRQVMAVMLAPGGVLLAWAGEFLLSSGDNHCVHGVRGQGCPGALPLNAWHDVGVTAMMVGAIMVIAALWLVTHTRRPERLAGL